MTWAVLAVILGGRLGYVLFYKPAYYFQNPVEILCVGQGGMSFHGGLLGLVVAILVFSRRRGFPMLALGDLVAAAALCRDIRASSTRPSSKASCSSPCSPCLRIVPGVARRAGLLTGVFFLGYGASRTCVELFREADAHLGFILGPLTMGQILSIPMILLGLYLIARALRRRARARDREFQRG